jgi:hypothetical protein
MLLAEILRVSIGGSGCLEFSSAYKCPLETLSSKIRAITKGLQSWSDKKIGNFRLQLDLAREIVDQFEIARGLRLLSPLDVWLLNSLKELSLALCLPC